MALYLLYERSSCYFLFKAHGLGEIDQNTKFARSSNWNFNRFSQIVQLTALHPSKSALDAHSQTNAMSQGYMSDELRTFLELNLPRIKEGEKPKFSLGVYETQLGSYIFEATKIPCQSNESVHLLRGVAKHFNRLIKDLNFRVYNAICLLDIYDKDFNSSAMGVRNYYSSHFPELAKIVNDNYLYARVSKIIEDKFTLSEEHVPMLTEVLGDEGKAREVVYAGTTSIGYDFSPLEMRTVQECSQRVMDLANRRKKVYDYLVIKMSNIGDDSQSKKRRKTKAKTEDDE